MDLNKYTHTNDPAGSLLHSNGYARIAMGDRLGSTTAESFERRRQIDSNRQLVKGYKRSSIGSSYGALRAKSVDANIGKYGALVGRPMSPSNQMAQHRFVEPNPRRYNPYA